MRIEYDVQDRIFYPANTDTTAWTITEVITPDSDVEYLLEKFSMYGGCAISEETFLSITDALAEAYKIT